MMHVCVRMQTTAPNLGIMTLYVSQTACVGSEFWMSESVLCRHRYQYYNAVTRKQLVT